jgi:mutator protein MutT
MIMKIVPVSIVIFVSNCKKDSCDLWMQRRKEDGPLDGLWEFPGGKIESQEDPIAAALREVKEEVGFECGKLKPFMIFPYRYSDRHIMLNVFYSFEEGNALPMAPNKKWFNINFSESSRPLEGQIPTVNHKVIDELSIYLQSQMGTEAKDFICKSL